jgi:hypothetical protein
MSKKERNSVTTKILHNASNIKVTVRRVPVRVWGRVRTAVRVQLRVVEWGYSSVTLPLLGAHGSVGG